MASPKTRRNLLLATVFSTNLLSLACQVIWVRKLSFLFGSTAAVFATVLSVFLLGLAFGALFAGRFVDRARRPWRFLAALEIGLGAYCLVSLPVFELARSFYLSAFPGDLAPLAAASAKFLVVLVAMIAPTLAIGAIFPVAVRLFSQGLGRLGGDVSLIYGLDTLGAATGALLAGFLFVTGLGLSASTWLLGAGAIGLGLLVLALGRDYPAAEAGKGGGAAYRKAKVREKKERERAGRAGGKGGPPAPAAEPELAAFSPAKLAAILATFFFSGGAALLLETGWNRFFYLLNGTNVYSLSSVLTGFLTGIGIGSLLVRRRIDRIRDPFAAVAYCYAVIALGGVLVFRCGTLFERLYLGIFHRAGGYYRFQLSVCLLIAAIVFLATVAMGANFPLVAKICARVRERRGFSVGQVFFWNTLGAVAGAFLGEFVLLPAWGFAGLLLVTLAVYAAAAVAFLALSPEPRRWRPAAACAALLAAAAALSPLGLGLEPPFHAVYYHGLRNRDWQEYRSVVDRMQVIHQAQGFYGQVSVVELDRYRLLKHNGKTDASTSVEDNRTQLLLGHLPLLFHPDPEEVLAIGLGGGATLRALVHHPEPKRITMVELDPLVTAAARTYFAGFNDRALEDPRVEVVTNDGRNYIDGSPKKYDVITSEPPNLWVSGVSGLFTEEFYRSARAHLTPGGILCQWMPLYEMRGPDFRITLATISSIFPHLAFWVLGSDVALVASDRPFTLDRARVERRLRAPGIARDLAEIQLPPGELLAMMAKPDVPPERLPGFIGVVPVLNRDDLPVLEFSTARNLFDFAKSGGPAS